MKIQDIKVGMTLRRKRCSHSGMNVGDTGVVLKVDNEHVYFTGQSGVAGHDPDNLEFVENPKPKQLPIFN